MKNKITSVKDLEDLLVPGNGKLVVKDGVIKATIVDCELDAVECYFGEDAVEINTEGYTYIALDIPMLKKLIKLIKEAEQLNR